MCHFVLALILLCLPCLAEDFKVSQLDPLAFFKIVSSIEQSNVPELRAHKNDDGSSYHLRGLCYLGQLHRDGQVYSVAQVHFLRSSPPGRDLPPPREHSFIILLDGHFRIVAYGESDYGILHMAGSKVMAGENEVADFASQDENVKLNGFGQLRMPYPFAGGYDHTRTNCAPAFSEQSARPEKPRTEQ
jgi:hypothetical protein